MNTHKNVIAMTVAAALGCGMLLSAGLSSAAEVAKSTTQATATISADAAAVKSQDMAIMKTADEAYKALREIRGARLAIFNGVPEQAVSLTTDAAKNLEIVHQSANTFAVKTSKNVAGDEIYVPFDTSIALAEGFVPSEAKSAALHKANQHLSKGEHENALNTLKLANIDISIKTALIPTASSLQHVQDAAKLMSEQKYYEANLALKAVEDSVILETYGVDAIPVQGSKG